MISKIEVKDGQVIKVFINGEQVKFEGRPAVNGIFINKDVDIGDSNARQSAFYRARQDQ